MTGDPRLLLRPLDAAHADAARQVFGERTDLRQAFASVDDPGFLQWLGVHGLREHADLLARFYPPVPPAELRATASCGSSPDLHLRSGAEDFVLLAELWELFAQRPFATLPAVLDFGCGCGRVLRWFASALPDAALVGADVRAASIAWLRDNLRGTFVANDVQPPLPLDDGAVDLVVSLSVFSHLNLQSNLAWIRELARVCKPDGLILLTSHGAFALAATIRAATHRDVLGMTAAEAAGFLRRLESERFLFHPAPAAIVRASDGVEADYGQTFFDAAFVRGRWRDHVELLACIPVAHVFLQDVYVLRPRR